jgi:GldM C-terminal domain
MKFVLSFFFFCTIAINTKLASQSMFISAEKMNVVYLGVDNLISIAVTEDSIVNVYGEGCKIEHLDGSLYNLKAEKNGIVKVKIKGKKYSSEKQFRAKSIPNPKPILGLQSDKKITVENFNKTQGVIMSLENFDFDARCRTTHYTILRIPLNGKRETVTVKEFGYTDEAKLLIQKATIGDIYIFNEINCNCSGDKVDRKLGVSLVVNIE